MNKHVSCKKRKKKKKECYHAALTKTDNFISTLNEHKYQTELSTVFYCSCQILYIYSSFHFSFSILFDH